MAEHKKKPKLKQLYTYISKRKKPWTVAVFNKKNKKRAVGKTLSETLKKFDKHPEGELIVIDYQQWKKDNDEDDNL